MSIENVVAASLCWLAALAGAIAFIRIQQQPPTQKRFGKLLCLAWLVISLSIYGFLPLLEVLPIGIDENALDDAFGYAFVGNGIASSLYLIWVYIMLRKYHRGAEAQLDFAEDEAGNPVRPTGGPPEA